MLPGAGLLANLEELDADLPGRGVELVQLLRGADDDALHVVARLAVRDHDDIERLSAVGVGLVPGEIRL